MENVLYPLLSFVPAVLNAGILLYLLFFVPREKTTDIFSFFVLALVLWQTEDTIVRLCASEKTALFWDRVLCIGWAGMAPIAFHFSCRYTSFKKSSSRFFLIGVYLPAILLYLFYIANSEPTQFDHHPGWGWILRPREGTLDAFQRLVISLYIIGALTLLFHYAYRLRGNRQKRRQAFLIAFGMLIPTVQGIITQLVFPVFFNKTDIPVTSSFMTLFSVATILSIRKYHLFNIADSISVENVLSNLKNIVFVISPKQEIIYMNPYAREVFGVEKSADSNIGITDIFPSALYFDAFVASVFLPSLNRKQVRNYPTIFQTSHGQQMNVLLTAERITTNQQVQGLLVVASDVTELSKTMRDLETSNQELERFAYVASHDLQEPLRKVSYFLQLLDIKYKDKIDETANVYINTAVGAAGQMRQLIQDLLAYSNLFGAKEQAGAVDMNEVVKKVLKTLSLSIEDAGAQILVEALPVLHLSNETQMVQLVQNLLSNSLKYRSGRTPVIRMFAEEEGEFWRFAVKDNGIGIAAQYQEKVFAVFQRLHSKSQYPGTGIGLSICKKIVEQHGGQIWIDSNADHGCTVFFTLPKHRPVNRRFSEVATGEIGTN